MSGHTPTPAEALRHVRQWLGADLFAEHDVHRESCRQSLALIDAALPLAEAQERAVEALRDLRGYAASVWFDEAAATDEERALMEQGREALAALQPKPKET